MPPASRSEQETDPSDLQECHCAPRSRTSTQQNQARTHFPSSHNPMLPACPVSTEPCNGTKAISPTILSGNLQRTTSAQRQSEKSASWLLLCPRGSWKTHYKSRDSWSVGAQNVVFTSYMLPRFLMESPESTISLMGQSVLSFPLIELIGGGSLLRPSE